MKHANENDVLFGLGNLINDHTGNKQFHQLAKEKLSSCVDAKKHRRCNEFYCSIAQHVQGSSLLGIFLRKDDSGTWHAVDDDESSCKVLGGRKVMKKEKISLVSDKSNVAVSSDELNIVVASDALNVAVASDESNIAVIIYFTNTMRHDGITCLSKCRLHACELKN